jgi:glycolate oxidase
MNFSPVSLADIEFFNTILSNKAVSIDSEMMDYSHDYTEDFVFIPELVLKPEDTKEVSEIMRYCFEKNIPVTPSGARTGLSGGALPVHKGVVLSMEKFNKIIEIDEKNHQVIVEPGVITQVLQDAVKEVGLFYPPDPASKGSCFIGGNVSENSGGPKAVKYGVTKDYVLNLEIVLPNGEVIWTGANVLKNATGYNLTQLIVGSEGTLAIITKIVMRLIPHPSTDMLMLVPFFDAGKACEAVAAIFQAGITPSGLEFMERDAILCVMDFEKDTSIELQDNHQAHLLIEVDGFDSDELMKTCEAIMVVLENFETDEILLADSQSQKDQLWKLRRKVGEAVKSHSIYKEEDTVVPRYELPKLLAAVKRIGVKYGFKSICYGHAGDGNLHVNILKGDLSDHFWKNELQIAISELFVEVIALGGTLSGEHGIGLVQKQYMPLAFNDVQLELMKSIKNVFDTKGILNPGKIF